MGSRRSPEPVTRQEFDRLAFQVEQVRWREEERADNWATFWVIVAEVATVGAAVGLFGLGIGWWSL